MITLLVALVNKLLLDDSDEIKFMCICTAMADGIFIYILISKFLHSLLIHVV